MMTRGTLPIELFELAIDFVDDEKTLRSTSLVCKAWLTRSQFNLFQVVELYLPRHLDHFVDLLHSSPHLAPFIKELCISENSLLALFRPAMSIVARLPLSLSAHPLVRPHRLTVHNQLWLPTRYNPDYLLGLSQFASVTSLDLFDVTFTTVADFSIVLRALRHLTALAVKHLDCQRQLDPETSAAIGSELPFLTTLRISSLFPTSVVDWLVKYNSFPSLTDAHISYELYTNDSGQGLGAFWASVGSTLERLTLSISKRATGSRFPTSVIESQLDLSACKALRALHFDCRHEREVTPDWSWLMWLLLHLNGRALRSASFAFQHSSHALASLHIFAAELDRVLAEAAFVSTLESVAFEFDHVVPADEDGEDEDAQALMHMFPALCSKGLLHFRTAAI